MPNAFMALDSIAHLATNIGIRLAVILIILTIQTQIVQVAFAIISIIIKIINISILNAAR